MLPYQLEREPVDRIDGAGKRKLALGGIAYLQPITRTQLGIVLGSEIALKESLQRLRTDGLIAPGPRSPEPGAPYTYITTTDFLSRWNLNSLQELPDLERLRDAGLLSKASVLGRTNLPI